MAPANPIGGMGATSVRMFLRMNLPEFYGLEVEEDPNGLIDKVYKVLPIVELSSNEKAELDAYQLEDVAQTMNEKLKDSRQIGAGPIE